MSKIDLIHDARHFCTRLRVYGSDSRGGTPGNSWWGCAVRFFNPDPISDHKM